MSDLDNLALKADRSGFTAWFMKWFVRLLRIVASLKRDNQ